MPPNNAKVVVVLNLKGGVGKTHTSWLLASVCEERSRRVLLVDTDTQANLSGSFCVESDDQLGVEVLFDPSREADVRRLIRTTDYSSIDLIPATAKLARYDISDRKAWEASDLHLSLVEPIEELRGDYDYIVIDCPPRLSVVSYAALCAADFVVIPLEAADWGAQGIVQVTAAIHEVQSGYNDRLQLLGYLVSRFKRARAYQKSYLAQLRAHFGGLSFDVVIPDLARFEQSVTDRIPITLHAPSSEESEIARTLFDEIETRIEGHRHRRSKRRPKDIRKVASVAAGR